jgi:branched-chain amino acid transport system permease protein
MSDQVFFDDALQVRKIPMLRQLFKLHNIAVAAFLAVLIILPLTLQGYEVNWMDLALLACLGALALNLLMGVAGQVSIGNAAFMAVGAFVAAGVAQRFPGCPGVVNVLLGAVAAGVLGLIVGIPALRLRGLYLAVATLALFYIVSYATATYQNDTVGAAGFFMPSLSVFGWNLGVDQKSWYYLLIIVVALSYLFFRRLTSRSRFGRAWLLGGDYSRAASAMGINVPRATVYAFIISSFLIGLEGALFAYFVGVLDSGDFTLALSIQYVAMIVIGGWGSMGGAMAGAVLITLLPLGVETLGSSLPQYGTVGSFITANIPALQGAVYGLLIVLFVLFQPRGLAYIVEATGRSVRRLFSRKVKFGEPHADESVERAQVFVTSLGHWSTEESDSTLSITPLLQVDDLRVEYAGGIAGTQSVSLFVMPGEITLLLGANGAGKSSSLRAISGFTQGEGSRITRGHINFDGKDATGLTPDKMMARGVALVPERDKIFVQLSVKENLLLGTRAGRRRGTSSAESLEATRLIEDLFPALIPLSDRKAGFLSGGERQMLAIARALLSKPRLLILDELSLGLAPVVVFALFDELRRINAEQGVTILMAEQSVAGIDIAQRVFLVEAGTTRWLGTSSEIEGSKELIESYLGSDVVSG